MVKLVCYLTFIVVFGMDVVDVVKAFKEERYFRAAVFSSLAALMLAAAIRIRF